MIYPLTEPPVIHAMKHWRQFQPITYDGIFFLRVRENWVPRWHPPTHQHHTCCFAAVNDAEIIVLREVDTFTVIYYLGCWLTGRLLAHIVLRSNWIAVHMYRCVAYVCSIYGPTKGINPKKQNGREMETTTSLRQATRADTVLPSFVLPVVGDVDSPLWSEGRGGRSWSAIN